MGKHTFYTNCCTSSEYDDDFNHVQIDLSPDEVARIFAARDLFTRIEAEHKDIAIESLKIRSLASFGDLRLEDEGMLEELNEGNDLYPEEAGWAEAWTEHSTLGDRIFVAEYGVEWQAQCKHSGTRVWSEIGWNFFEVHVLRYGLVELISNSDAKSVAAGIIKSRDVSGDASGLPILADALDEAGNPAWVGNRLREVMKDFGSGVVADRIIYGEALRKLAGTRQKARPRGKRKKA